MAPRLSDVWLRLYQLSEALDTRGAHHDERLVAVMDELSTMPPELQQQTWARLELVNRFASDLISRRG